LLFGGGANNHEGLGALAGKIVHAIWNERRAWAMEHETINTQMVKMAPDFAVKSASSRPLAAPP
jgi:hypothetical protein